MKSLRSHSFSEEGKYLDALLKLISKYIKTINDSHSLVIDYQSPEDLKEAFDLPISEVGTSFDEIISAAESYLDNSVKTTNKFFFNQLYGGFNIIAILGEIITSLTNTSMYTYEVAPLATLIEKELIGKMNGCVGFHHGTGQFVTGGSNANLIAVLCARNKAIPGVKENGLRLEKALTMFVSDQAHYSFLKAANVLGIGADNVILVKTDDNGRMLIEALEKEICESIQQGKKPFFVAATAGTTVLGSFDPINEVANIAKKYDLWLHVDGALGGSALLSRKYRYLLKGCEIADSFTWDPHKMMTIPLVCSVILVKDYAILPQTCSSDGTDYLFHDYENQAYDLGPMSLQCGRRVDALKLWLSWKYYGDLGYEARIDRLFELTEYASEVVLNETRLELMYPIQSVTVCFRYIPKENEDFNEFNLRLRDRLIKSGKSMINYSYLDGHIILRLVFVNPEVDTSDVDIFFNNLLKIGKSLTQG